MVQAFENAWCIQKLEWNGPIAGKLLPVWQAWDRRLALLQNITVPCCYVPACADEDPKVELHTF